MHDKRDSIEYLPIGLSSCKLSSFLKDSIGTCRIIHSIDHTAATEPPPPPVDDGGGGGGGGPLPRPRPPRPVGGP